jgi:glycosyltransferase involved in cell wall biosynthesis
MPVKGEALFLLDTLRSISNYQNCSTLKIETLIVDDGISNGGIEMLNEFGNSIGLKILRNSGTGIVDALNTGLNSCSTRFVARLDSDDLILPDRLEKQIWALQNRPRLSAIGGQILLIDKHGRPLPNTRYPVGSKNVKKAMKFRNSIAHPAVTFRLDRVLEVGGYHKFFEFSEDYDLWLRILEAGEIDNLHDFVIKYRVHSQQLSLQRSEGQYYASLAAQIASENRKNSTPEIQTVFTDIDTWKLAILTNRNPYVDAYQIKLGDKIHLKIQLFRREQKILRRYFYIFCYSLIRPKSFLEMALFKLKNLIKYKIQ